MLLVAQSAIAQINIAEVRKMKAGKVVTVAGRVTASKEFGDIAFIQDRTGGIAVYGMRSMPTRGDSVRVTGELAKYNGMLEIVTDSMHIIASNIRQVTPKDVTFPEDHEGELIRLTKVRLEPQKHFFYPKRAGNIITTRDTIQYWIDDDTDIPGYTIPGSLTSITGVVGRYNDQIQILPTSHADIENSNIQYPMFNNQFKVLNWNVEFFGAARQTFGSEFGPANEALQIENVAKVLNASHADLIALQEVSDNEAFKRLLALMPGYEGRCSNRYSYFFENSNDFPPQKLCFVYKTSIVKVVSEKILFKKQFDEAPSDMFSSGRLPYLLEAEVLAHRISFINYHGKSGDNIADYRRRDADARLLKDSLDLHYSKKNMVLLGDFNDDVDQSITKGSDSPYRNFMNDDRYSSLTKTLSDQHWYSTISYNDMIDHQLISAPMTGFYVDNSTVVINPFILVPKYETTTSDHLPVLSEFDMTKLVTQVIPDNESNKGLVYPNPTDGEVWVRSDITNVTIINSTGTTVYKKTDAHSPISLGECAPGIYTLILENQVVRLIKR